MHLTRRKLALALLQTSSWLLLWYPYQAGSMLCISHNNYGLISLRHTEITIAQCCAFIWLNAVHQAPICSSVLCIRHQYDSIWLYAVHQESYGSISLHHACIIIMAQCYQASIYGSMLCIRHQYGSISLNILHASIIMAQYIYTVSIMHQIK